MEHDQHGLLDKYLVFRRVEEGTDDPSVVTIMVIDREGEGKKFKGRPVRTKKFILSPEKVDDYGYASREAIRTYANEIENRNPKLADDLRRWMDLVTDNLPAAEIGDKA
jgi:hypothetical protein